jgi:hypothetical protein
LANTTYESINAKNWPSFTEYAWQTESNQVSGASLLCGYGVKKANTSNGVVAATTGAALYGVLGRRWDQDPDTAITQYKQGYPVIPMQDKVVVPVTIETASGVVGVMYKGSYMALGDNSNGKFQILPESKMAQVNMTGYTIVGKLYDNYVTNDDTKCNMEMGK